jgi:hypothetical protein
MISLGPVLFDNNNRVITLSGGYKNLRYLTPLLQPLTCIKTTKLFKKLMYCCLLFVCLHLVVAE